jgi:hypothetical protein
MGFSGIVVLAAPKLYHEKPLSINLFGEGIDNNDWFKCQRLEFLL